MDEQLLLEYSYFQYIGTNHEGLVDTKGNTNKLVHLFHFDRLKS